MQTSHKSIPFLSAVLLLSVVSAAGQVSQAPSAADLAQRQVTAYLAKLADLHCTETVTQEKLTGNGHVEASEHAKYDYLIMIDGNGDDLQLNESRIEASASHRKQLPMLVTNGFSTVLLVFHPYYRDSFTFDTGADEIIDGKEVIPIHFSHIPGRRSPAALALRGREYPLDLKGTAWLDRKSGDVVRMDVGLLNDMSDIGLRSLMVRVDYKSATLSGTAKDLNLPSVAVVEVTTPRQHWRNTHVFDAYKSFSTDAEQDSHVRIRADNATMDKDRTASAATSDTKEKP
jgi:hypothetical protein